MNYMEIYECDTSNHLGVGVSLFVSGCPYHCKGCFNPQSWPYEAGQPFTTEEMNRIITALQQPGRTGFSLLGGEPLCDKNREECAKIVKTIKLWLPHINIWVYTGGTYEQHMKDNDPSIMEIFSMIDVLVDGPFVEELKDLRLNFRGSKNQRIIDMQKTLKENTVVLHPLNN